MEKKGNLTMKKQVIAAALGLSMFALPVFAKDDHKGPNENGMRHGLKLGVFKNILGNFSESQFVVSGKIESVATGSFVVKANAVAHVSNMTNGLVTIKTDANTKFSTAVAVGQNVVASGNISGSDLLATNVRVLNSNGSVKKEEKKPAMGRVTAKTDTSVTITNTLSNTSQTITTDANTQVKINGETKTVADINVGDSGWIKFKTMGTTLVAKIIRLFR